MSFAPNVDFFEPVAEPEPVKTDAWKKYLARSRKPDWYSGAPYRLTSLMPVPVQRFIPRVPRPAYLDRPLR